MYSKYKIDEIKLLGRCIKCIFLLTTIRSQRGNSYNDIH